jgi:SAM-dependent methyltransferase
VLDLGCGPGTLSGLVASTCPEAEVVGVEPDPVMLERARRAEGERVRFLAADATTLPAHPPFDRPFDVCASTLMFHHLEPAQKRAALAEALRVLAPGGRLVVADWGPPATPTGRAAFAITRVFDGLEVTRAHADGGFEAMLRATGVVAFAERGRWPTPVGTLCLYTARKP